MPYSSVSELPAAVRAKLKSPKRRRQWMHVWNSSYERHGDESRAFAEAWATAQKRATEPGPGPSLSKDDAEYQDFPNETSGDRCQICSMFRDPDGCSLVRGIIDPDGWCKHFDPLRKAAKTMNDFSFFLPISKVEKQKDGSVLISGYASTPALDLDGEIVSLDAVKKALPGYWAWRNIREMHTPSAVGVAKEANVDEKGLFLTSKIVDKSAVQKVLEGVYKGYSIGGRKLAKNGNTITEIELVEVSVVDRPANPECKFDVAKAASSGVGAYLVKTPGVRRDPKDKALGQMAKAVRTLAKAGPPAAHDGFSLPAKVDKADDPLQPHLIPVDKNGGDDMMVCPRHGLADCPKCAMKKRTFISKREFSESQRQAAARAGQANPDGSFPIRNKKDLQNARRAFGRSKNKPKTRNLIRTRARQLGVKLPDKWTKKSARILIGTEIMKRAASLDLPGSASTPSFLTLGVEKAKKSARSMPSDQFVLGKVKSGHGLDLETGNPDAALPGFLSLSKGGGRGEEDFLVLDKGMSSAGALASCFDQIRSIQRSLMMEAKREGGDKKDKALAKELGRISSELAAVIGQKVSHEGEEALDLTDADDLWLTSTLGEDLAMGAQTTNIDGLTKFLVENGMVDPKSIAKRGAVPTRAARMAGARQNLKKAAKARKEASSAIMDAHKVLKARYLSKQALIKAGKKPVDDDGDDDAEVMKNLQKAYGALSTLKTFMKAADGNIKKAAGRSGQRGQEVSDGEGRFYTVPPGVKDLSPSEMATASPGGQGSGSEPPIYPADGGVYPGKSARKMMKGMVSQGEAEALARAAAAEAKVELLEKAPMATGSRPRPYSFDVNRAFGDGGDNGANKSELTKALFDGVNTSALMSGDEEAHTAATARIIGNMVTQPGKFGKSLIFDPNFRGKAGFKNAANGG